MLNSRLAITLIALALCACTKDDDYLPSKVPAETAWAGNYTGQLELMSNSGLAHNESYNCKLSISKGQTDTTYNLFYRLESTFSPGFNSELPLLGNSGEIQIDEGGEVTTIKYQYKDSKIRIDHFRNAGTMQGIRSVFEGLKD